MRRKWFLFVTVFTLFFQLVEPIGIVQAENVSIFEVTEETENEIEGIEEEKDLLLIEETNEINEEVPEPYIVNEVTEELAVTEEIEAVPEIEVVAIESPDMVQKQASLPEYHVTDTSNISFDGQTRKDVTFRLVSDKEMTVNLVLQVKNNENNIEKRLSKLSYFMELEHDEYNSARCWTSNTSTLVEGDREGMLATDSSHSFTFKVNLFKGTTFVGFYFRDDDMKLISWDMDYSVAITNANKYKESIDVWPALEVGVGKSKSLFSKEGDTIKGKKIVWSSSDSSVVRVNKDGEATGVSSGKAVISATLHNGKEYRTEVTVQSPALNHTNLHLIKGEKQQLQITDHVDSVVYQSSDSSVASVDSNGLISAKKKGNAVITAVVGNHKLKCSVGIETPNISRKSLNLTTGRNAKLKVEGTKQTVKWSSKNKNVAIVDADGNVIGKAKGKTIITAIVGSKKMTCAVTVKGAAQKSTYIVLEKGDSRILKINQKAKNVKWKSVNAKIASVNAQGKVTGKKAGITTIRCRVNGKNYYCSVKVTTPKLSESTITLEQGIKQKLTVAGTKKKVSWKSSNTKIATVDKNGYVKGQRWGSTVITAYLEDRQLKCKVKVVKEKPDFTFSIAEKFNSDDETIMIRIENKGKKPLLLDMRSINWYSDDNAYSRCYTWDTPKILEIPSGETEQVNLRVEKRSEGSFYYNICNHHRNIELSHITYSFEYDEILYRGTSSRMYPTEYYEF